MKTKRFKNTIHRLRRRLAGALALVSIGAMSIPQVKGDIIVNISEDVSANEVTVSWDGSVRLEGLTFLSGAGGPNGPYVLFGADGQSQQFAGQVGTPVNVDRYTGGTITGSITAAGTFTSTGFTRATDGYIGVQGTHLQFTTGYVSGQNINQEIVISNSTFASLGLVAGDRRSFSWDAPGFGPQEVAFEVEGGTPPPPAALHLYYSGSSGGGTGTYDLPDLNNRAMFAGWSTGYIEYDRNSDLLYGLGGGASPAPGIFTYDRATNSAVTIVEAAAAGRFKLDSGAGKIYWNFQNDLWRADLDGSNRELVIDDPTLTLWGFELDLTNGHVYYFVHARGLYRTDLDGNGLERMGTVRPVLADMAIDEAGGWIYWVTEPSLQVGRINTAGTVSEFVGPISPANFKNGTVAVDAERGRLYAANGHALYSMDLDGGDSFSIFPSPIGRGGSIAVGRFSAPSADPEIQVYDGSETSDPEITDGQVAAVDFGPTSGTATRNITVENSGDADLNISSIDVTGTDMANFAVIGPPAVVAMGDTETFQVQFAPGANGARSATLTINNNDPDEAAFDFPLAGTGDNTPPVLGGLPADMQVPTVVGETDAQVFFAPPTATDETSPANPAVTCDHESGDMFQIGSTTVTCSATDDAGNTATATFNVVVIETRPTEAGPEDVDFVAGGIESSNPIIRAGGAAAPGGPKGTTFFSVNHAFLNNSGEILVEANLTGGPATQNLGLWSNGGGNPLQLVALESGATTGSNFAGTTYKSFGHIALNSAGVVGANLLVKDGGTTGATDRGTFSELSTGTFTGGIREGSTAPGAGAAIFSVIQDPALAEQLIAHPGQLKIDSGAGVGGTNDRGLWGSDGTTNSLIIREGDSVTATGIMPGVTYGQLENRIVATGDDTIAFSSLLQGNGGANKAIFAGQPGNLRLIAARNDIIGGVQIASFAAESLNDAGDVAFRAVLAGQPAASNGGIFTDIGGTQKLIAQEGDAAPGQSAGVVFDRFVDLHLLDDGDVIFLTYLRGGTVSSANDCAIYRHTESTGTLAPVVREGDLATSTDGAVLRQLRDFDANASGGVVYTATLAPGIGDATTADNLGLWHSPDSSLPPLLKARKGDEFVYQAGTGKGDPDDVRTITTLSIDRVRNPAGGVGSTPKVINDSGQAIIKVSNTLGGGAFVIGSGDND